MVLAWERSRGQYDHLRQLVAAKYGLRSGPCHRMDYDLITSVDSGSCCIFLWEEPELCLAWLFNIGSIFTQVTLQACICFTSVLSSAEPERLIY